jgi:hypothetical protein
VDTGRCNLDVLAVADQPAKQSFRDRTTADIARANKKDAFHDVASRLRTRNQRKFEREQGQSNEAFGERQFAAAGKGATIGQCVRVGRKSVIGWSGPA